MAVIVGVALKSTVGLAMRCRGVLGLWRARVIPAVETMLLMGISVGMSFVIVFMLGPALGEMLRLAAG